MHFDEFANLLSPLDEVASDELRAKVKSKSFERGDCLLKIGQVCSNIYFVEAGLAKTCFSNGDKEFIMRFFTENSMFTVLDSYLQLLPSNYDIIALEQTTVSFVAKKDMDALCVRYHCIETFLRSLISLASVNMMKRISEMLEENATQRYNHFLSEQGEMLKRISLADLASYLGITQVSLSRIRAKK